MPKNKTSQSEKNGWIFLWRKLFEKRIWLQSTKEHKVIMITLLLMASYKKKSADWNGKPVILKPGSMITNLEKIREQSGKDISVQNVRTALDNFEDKYEFLTQEVTSAGRYITILNWKKYQCSDKPNQQTDQQKENAQKLYYFYLEKIEPIRKTKIRTISNILRHAKKYSFKDLARAVANYKTVMPRDITYRKDPANFFGVNEPYFKDFLPENFGKVDVREQAVPVALTDEKLRELNE